MMISSWLRGKPERLSSSINFFFYILPSLLHSIFVSLYLVLLSSSTCQPCTLLLITGIPRSYRHARLWTSTLPGSTAVCGWTLSHTSSHMYHNPTIKLNISVQFTTKILNTHMTSGGNTHQGWSHNIIVMLITDLKTIKRNKKKIHLQLAVHKHSVPSNGIWYHKMADLAVYDMSSGECSYAEGLA